jgi:hypothetical protein
MKRINFLIVILIIFIGAFFRLVNVNWDSNFHLHPDERFLTMVGNATTIPLSFNDYINPSVSTLNPYNVGFDFFVYGTFPLTLNKLVAVNLNNDNYNDFTTQGRIFAASIDICVILMVFLLLKILENKYKFSGLIKYIAMFLYASSVLPIQLSHFFTVDAFLNFFVLSSVLFAIAYSEYKKKLYLSVSAVFFGFAMASKITAGFALPLILIFLIGADLKEIKNLFRKFNKNEIYALSKKYIIPIMIFLLLSYISLRIANPQMFQNVSFLDPSINTKFIQNIQTLKSFENKDILFPPSVQWSNKLPVIFSLQNLAFFGIGIPYFVFFVLGFIVLIKNYKNTYLILLTTWVILYFLYQSAQAVQTMRYFLMLYPFIAIISSFGVYYVIRKINPLYKILVLLMILIWPLFFLSVYMYPHTRVQASEWIYDNLPNESVILAEYWDDALPLPVDSSSDKIFIIESLPVFETDSPAKIERLQNMLKAADYYILSSNRAYASIMDAPGKYPMMSKFYEELFGEKLGYKIIKEFSSYPSLKYLGLSIYISDDDAEEAFTVYDHPKVIIFKNVTR